MKAAVVSAALLLAAASPAPATTVNVAGGTWSYDSGANTAWSNYKHPKNEHTSSVQTGDSITRSACTAPGQWSLASRVKTGPVHYYYNPDVDCD